MTEYEAQNFAVEGDHRFKTPFRRAVEPALLGLVFMLEDSRAHHRSQREGYYSRNKNGDAQGDRKFAEQTTDDVGHEQQRDQHRDQRNGQRYDREADLWRTFQGGLHSRFAFFDVT